MVSDLGTSFTLDKASKDFHLTHKGHSKGTFQKMLLVRVQVLKIVRNISNIKILKIKCRLVTNGGRCIGAYVLNIDLNKVITFNKFN